jgi:hypothetical protein
MLGKGSQGAAIGEARTCTNIKRPRLFKAMKALCTVGRRMAYRFLQQPTPRPFSRNFVTVTRTICATPNGTDEQTLYFYMLVTLW